MRCVLALWLTALVAGAAAFPAAAQISRAQPAHIGPDSASSTCIGQATGAATCAVETLLACLARGDQGLCSRVGVSAPAPTEPHKVEYVIDRISVIRPEDVDQDMQELDWYKPGNTLAEVSRRTCAISAPTCDDESWEELQVYLRRGDSGAWRVETWRGEEEEVPTDQPEMTQSGEGE